MPLTFEIVYTCASIKNTNPMKCSVTATYIYFKAKIFLYIYVPLNIPHLSVIYVFPDMMFLLQFINILNLTDIFVLLTSMTTYVSLFGRHISISFFMPVTLGIVPLV